MNKFVNEFENIHMGETIMTTNGSEYIVVAINAKRDRTLLMQKGCVNYIGAWALQKCRGENEYWYWGQGHYFGEDFFSASEYVNGGKRVLTNEELANEYDKRILMRSYIMKYLNCDNDYANHIYNFNWLGIEYMIDKFIEDESECDEEC